MRSRLLSVLSFVMLVALLAGSLAGCAPTPAPVPTTAPAPTAAPQATTAPAPTTAPAKPALKGGPLEVGVLWAEGSPSFNLAKAMGDQMEKDIAGTKLTYTFNNTAARPAIEMRMQAGDPLDVDFMFDGMNPASYSWVDGGYLLDLTVAMNEKRADGTTWKDDFNPLFLPAMTYKDKLYAVPQQVFIMLLHYNKKMFDEWGLKPPTTWDELLQTCETIKGKGVAPIAVTGQNAPYVGQWYDHLLQRTIGTEKAMAYLYGDTAMKTTDEPAFLQVAKEVNKLKEKGYLIEGWQGTDFTTAQVYFFQGKAAMMMMGSWLMSEMKDSIPAGFELAVAPFPAVTGGKGNQTAMFGRALSWSVPAKAKNPELAIEYLRRFTSNEEAGKRTSQLGAMSPNRKVPPPSGIIGADQVLKDAETAEFVFYYYGNVQAKYGLKDAWYNPLVEMWMGTLTPEQAMAKIDTNIEAVRAQRKQQK